MLITVAGQESSIGKAAAIAQATISTFQAANNILATASASPETVLFPGYPSLMVGLTIANGLATVGKIAGVSFFAEGTDDAPYTGKAIVDEIGAEIHTDSSGKIKSFGSESGARFTDIVKGDRIIPADISAIIKQNMYSGFNLNQSQQAQIDYAEMGKQFGIHANKIISAVNQNGKNQLIVNVAKNNMDRVTFRGRKV